MHNRNLGFVFQTLRKTANKFQEPLAQKEAKLRDPYRVVIGVLMSSRTKDHTTGPALQRLFEKARTPKEMLTLDEETIAKLIFPVGFYKTKAKHIKALSKKLLMDFKGMVPKTMEELLSLPGIGRKSANLTLGVAFNIPSICVDTHVHRITNRWGYVNTNNPLHTEIALRNKLPKKYWIEINRLLVVYGQNVCTPLSPWCSKCEIKTHCEKIGVLKER